MKYIKKVCIKNMNQCFIVNNRIVWPNQVDDSYSLKNLFNEHVAKFNLKHEQELVFLDDVRSFIEKKSQLELQYSQV